MVKFRLSKFNKKCDNPYCFNQVIQESSKKPKRWCKVCNYVYILGRRMGNIVKKNDKNNKLAKTDV
jgi:hypothetical protein